MATLDNGICTLQDLVAKYYTESNDGAAWSAVSFDDQAMMIQITMIYSEKLIADAEADGIDPSDPYQAWHWSKTKVFTKEEFDPIGTQLEMLIDSEFNTSFKPWTQLDTYAQNQCVKYENLTYFPDVLTLSQDSISFPSDDSGLHFISDRLIIRSTAPFTVEYTGNKVLDIDEGEHPPGTYSPMINDIKNPSEFNIIGYVEFRAGTTTKRFNWFKSGVVPKWKITPTTLSFPARPLMIIGQSNVTVTADGPWTSITSGVGTLTPSSGDKGETKCQFNPGTNNGGSMRSGEVSFNKVIDSGSLPVVGKNFATLSWTQDGATLGGMFSVTVNGRSMRDVNITPSLTIGGNMVRTSIISGKLEPAFNGYSKTFNISPITSLDIGKSYTLRLTSMNVVEIISPNYFTGTISHQTNVTCSI